MKERVEAAEFVAASLENESSITDGSKPYLLVVGTRRRYCGCRSVAKYCERSRKGRNVK